jgi:hypothetical protein
VEKTIQWWSGYVICSAVTYAFAALSATRLTLSDMQRHRQLIGLRQLLQGDRRR